MKVNNNEGTTFVTNNGNADILFNSSMLADKGIDQKLRIMNIQALTNEELLKEYSVAHSTYLTSTRDSSITDIKSFSTFAKSKEYLRTITNELKRRGIRLKKY